MITPTDWRALCAELVAGIDNYDFDLSSTQQDYSVLERARAALAQPEPEGPTFIEVMQLADDFFTFRGNSHGGAFFATEITAKTDPGQALEQFAHAVLTRWGRLSIEPVPVSERLPGPEDCDAEDECYWFDPAGTGAWYLDTYQGNYTHWLPHHALPVPATRKDD